MVLKDIYYYTDLQLFQISLVLGKRRNTVLEAHIATSTSNLSNDSRAVTPACTHWVGTLLDTRVQNIKDAYGRVLDS